MKENTKEGRTKEKMKERRDYFWKILSVIINEPNKGT
jgi:hypothetical protein